MQVFESCPVLTDRSQRVRIKDVVLLLNYNIEGENKVILIYIIF